MTYEAPHERGDICDCISDDGSCYWDGYGTALGHRGAIGPPGDALDRHFDAIWEDKYAHTWDEDEGLRDWEGE